MSPSVLEAAVGYLKPDNQHLEELKARYARFSAEATTPLHWDDSYLQAEEIFRFRGDNAYMWQLRGDNMNAAAYALATYYIRSIDKLGLIDRLEEDGLFGACTFEVGGRRVSRDLLDSIIEINFLERHLQLSSREHFRVLDIGAGYGRLAHRMLAGLPNVERYLCTDAVAVSTFISEYYLRFRGLDDRAKVVPLDEIDAALQAIPVNLAINIHSFSECHLPAIEWWLSLLERHRVEYLMLVPNANDHGGERLRTNDDKDFHQIIERHGYRQVAMEPKYLDTVVQAHAINPTCHYLFRIH